MVDERGTMIITSVRPWGGPLTTMRLEGGRIAAIGPDVEGPPGGSPSVDGRGRLAIPAFSDVHVHLDSTRLGLPFRPHSTKAPGLWNQVMNDRDHWREAEASVSERATTTLGLGIAHGATRVRAYAQVDADCRLERFEGVAEARETHRERADVEIMAFPQAGLLIEPGVPALMDAALAAGADVMGGLDPCAMDADPVEHLDIVFGLAEKHGVPIDIHLHEPGELGLFSLHLVLERVRALGLVGRVTVSHAFCLGSGLPGVEAALEEIAALDVRLATVAPAGRGALPVTRISELGIRLGLGQDGQRDYWSPYGNGDMLDRTWQLAFTQGFRLDELVEHAVAVATVGGASLMDLGVEPLRGLSDRPGLAIGDPGDLVLLAGDTVTAAVMDRSPDRTVVRGGVVVADHLELVGT
jgi:cytosine/adenosine deaminase-related metal-dependent hydrolase